MWASTYNCAIVLIGHLSKKEGGKEIYRGLESIDLAASVRSVFHVQRDQEDEDIRIVKQIKNNLAPKGSDLRFEIRSETGFRWLEAEENSTGDAALSDNSQIPIRFGLFKGKSKASSMYAVREFGNDCLLYSLDGILRYGEVLNVPQADERERIVERKEVPLFNQKAYREAVINAFVHNHWLDGAPAFTVFQDRIEILSKGLLPPKQTMDGFFAGESVPVNEKLARIILQLHISEQTGRGVPAIVETYGKEVFRFSENNIRVTIPFKRLEKAADAPVNKGNTPVDAPVDAPVNVPVNAPVGKGYTPVNREEVLVKNHDGLNSEMDSLSQEERILVFCEEPKSTSEIAEYLGYKDKRSIRKRLNPLLEQGRIAMTVPDKPNSRLQKYITIR
jgi:predicted HTH transcriptional regulator